jgi:hypothetical protein
MFGSAMTGMAVAACSSRHLSVQFRYCYEKAVLLAQGLGVCETARIVNLMLLLPAERFAE